MRILTGVEKSNDEHWHLMPEFQLIGDTTKDYYLLSNIEEGESTTDHAVYLYQKKPSKLARLTLENITDITFEIDYENNYITYSGEDWDSNYMHGLLDTSGNVVLPFCFLEIRIVGSFIWARYHEGAADEIETYKNARSYGFDRDGTEICEARNIEHLYQNYYILTGADSFAKDAIINGFNGKFLTPFFDEILFDTPGFICTKTAGKYQLRMMNDLENTIAEEPEPISNPIFLQNQLKGYITGRFGREKLILSIE